MAFQAVLETAEVTIIFNQNLEVVTNTFHAKKVGGYDQDDIEFLALKANNFAESALRPAMTLDAVYDRVEVRGLSTENDLFAVNDLGQGPGALISEGLPNSVTLSLKKVSGFTGRSARGRWYFVGMPEDSLASNENVYDPVRVAIAVLSVESIRIGVTEGGWSPVIVSRFTGGIEREFGATFPWIDTVAVDDNVDTQRRRLTR